MKIRDSVASIADKEASLLLVSPVKEALLVEGLVPLLVEELVSLLEADAVLVLPVVLSLAGALEELLTWILMICPGLPEVPKKTRLPSRDMTPAFRGLSPESRVRLPTLAKSLREIWITFPGLL